MRYRHYEQRSKGNKTSYYAGIQTALGSKMYMKQSSIKIFEAVSQHYAT